MIKIMMDNDFAVLPHEKIMFPVGEMHVRAPVGLDAIYRINWEFESSDEIVELMLLCDALRRQGKEYRFEIPYFPFARQDRVAVHGECLSVAVMAKLINSLQPLDVTIWDPHSDVTTALINNVKVVEQHQVFRYYLADKKDFWLIAPDAGAIKKIYKLASVVDTLGVVECSKYRDTKTGEIRDTFIHDFGHLDGKECFIVDDICDGGRTFIEIAKKLKDKNAGKITLMVTHGFFTKGLEVFDGLIDHIITRKGVVK